MTTERWLAGTVVGAITLAVASSDPVEVASYAEQPQSAQRDGGDYVLDGVR